MAYTLETKVGEILIEIHVISKKRGNVPKVSSKNGLSRSNLRDGA
jgi:hypothetical protein